MPRSDPGVASFYAPGNQKYLPHKNRYYCDVRQKDRFLTLRKIHQIGRRDRLNRSVNLHVHGEYDDLTIFKVPRRGKSTFVLNLIT